MFHRLIAMPIKRQDTCHLGLRSILQVVEVNSIPLNPAAYSGEIWLTSFDVSVGLNYSPVGHAPEFQLPPLLTCETTCLEVLAFFVSSI